MFRVWEVKPWNWGFLVSGFGFTVGEGDVLEERERCPGREIEREERARWQMEWAWRMQGRSRGFEGLGMVREEAGDFSGFGALGRRRNAERESELRGGG